MGLHAVPNGTNGSKSIGGVCDGLGVLQSPPGSLMTYHRRMLNILGLSMGWCLMISVMFIQLSTTTLAARDYTGSATSTLPAGIMMAAATVSMTPGSLLMQRFGRKPVLLISAAAGIGGGVLLVLAAQFKLLWLLIVGSIPLGVCFAQANSLRFAATEFAPAGQQHKALSLVVTGAVLACVVGPEVGRHTLHAMKPPYTATYCFVTGLCLLYAILVAVVEFHMLPVLAAAAEKACADGGAGAGAGAAASATGTVATTATAAITTAVTAAVTSSGSSSSSSTYDGRHGMAPATAGSDEHGLELPTSPQALAVANPEAGPETGALEGARTGPLAEARGALEMVGRPPPRSSDRGAHKDRQQALPSTTRWLQYMHVGVTDAQGSVAAGGAAEPAAVAAAMAAVSAGVGAAGAAGCVAQQCISHDAEGATARELVATWQQRQQQQPSTTTREFTATKRRQDSESSCPGLGSGCGSGPVAEATVVASAAVGAPLERHWDSESAMAGQVSNKSHFSGGSSSSNGHSSGPEGGIRRESLRRLFLSWGYLVPVITASLSYFTMAGMMTASPLAIRDSKYSFGETTQVIQVHIICMFLPSLFTGDVIGLITAHMTMTCGSVLLAAGAAIFFAGQHLPIFFAGNSVVGLGWNWSYVGASALVTNTYDSTTKFVAQGVMDTLVLFGTGLSGVLAGPLYSRLGWGAYTAFFVGWSGVMVTVDVLFLVALLRRRRKAAAAAAAGK